MIKVSDFGLTEDMYCSNYYRHQVSDSGTEEKLPIKWMAPECIETNVFDESTDVVRIIHSQIQKLLQFFCLLFLLCMSLIVVCGYVQWSFGVTCWEVFTCGGVPYAGVPATTLLRELRCGHRLNRPSNTACSDDM